MGVYIYIYMYMDDLVSPNLGPTLGCDPKSLESRGASASGGEFKGSGAFRRAI